MKAIEIKNLKKYFGRTKAVDGINLTVEKGEIFGFLGPNGAGKTTTIRCILDVLRPTSGDVRILGLDPKNDGTELRSKISFLPGGARLYDGWSGEDHVDFIKSFGGERSIADKLIKNLDLDTRKKFKNLSSGNKQKLSLILALMKRPEVLILDEPTNALDPLLQNQVHKTLREFQKDGMTIFMSSHNLSEVDQTCSRVAIIKEGKIVSEESIKGLKEKRIHSVAVVFDSKVSKDQFKIEGIKNIEEIDSSLIISFLGDIDPLIKELSKHKIKEIEISHATLEEIFLEFYQK
jgi:ABC-2 type transport system ATP-binding protein